VLEVEWDEICRKPKVESVVPMNHETNVLGLKGFLHEKCNIWAGNGNCVEEIWRSYKDIILDGIKRNIPQKNLSKNPDPRK